jgi:pentatricopeptide repeat protein
MAPGTVQLDRFSWNTRLARYGKAGQHEKTIALFQEMQKKGMTPNTFTFVPVLNACASLRALEEGRHVHEQIIQSGCEGDAFVGCSLVDMYAKCGSMEDAQRVFNKMSSRDAVTWNAVILGRGKCGQGQKALELFSQVQQEGVKPDSVMFVGVVNACAICIHLRVVLIIYYKCIHLWLQIIYYLFFFLCTLYIQMYTFVVDDQDHPQMVEICAILKRLSGLMHDAGYVPHTTIVLHDVEEEEKVSHLCHHSENLAIAFRLLNTAPGTPL